MKFRLALAWLALLPAPAFAAPDEAVRAVQSVANIAPLEADAFRFTMADRGTGTATVYEARPAEGGYQRTIIVLTPQAAAPGGWLIVSRETKRLAAETFQYFLARIDGSIAAAAADESCPEEPSYYAEHGPAARAGGCGPEAPNARIARALGLIDDDGVYSGRKSGTER